MYDDACVCELCISIYTCTRVLYFICTYIGDVDWYAHTRALAPQGNWVIRRAARKRIHTYTHAERQLSNC